MLHTFRLISSKRLHGFLPTSYNSCIKLVEILSHAVRFKHNSRAQTGSGASLHNARSGKRESGKTHHGKFENEIENEESTWQDESNKLLDDK